MKTDRETILNRAMVRGPFPGMRQLTGGVFILGQLLGLQAMLPEAKKRDDLTPEERALEGIAQTWLLDADIPLADIREAVAHGGRGYVFKEILPAYGDTVPLVKMRLAQKEVAIINEEVAACDYAIEPKPDEKPGDTPAGKS